MNSRSNMVKVAVVGGESIGLRLSRDRKGVAEDTAEAMDEADENR